jgi:hypothetical protein
MDISNGKREKIFIFIARHYINLIFVRNRLEELLATAAAVEVLSRLNVISLSLALEETFA